MLACFDCDWTSTEIVVKRVIHVISCTTLSNNRWISSTQPLDLVQEPHPLLEGETKRMFFVYRSKVHTVRKLQITIALNRIKVRRNQIENALMTARKELIGLLLEKKETVIAVKAEQIAKDEILLECFTLIEYHLGIPTVITRG